MKRRAAAVLFCVMIAVMSINLNGCDKLKDGLFGRPTKPSQVVETEDSPKVLSPESAVEIYMNNIDMWRMDVDYTVSPYRYGFLDMDFDGVLELVASKTEGSIRGSINKYYRINLTDYSLEEINYRDEATFTKAQTFCDFNVADYPQLVSLGESGEKRYVTVDYVRMGDSYGLEYQYLYLEENKVVFDYLHSMTYIAPFYTESGEEEYHYYRPASNHGRVEISEADWELLLEQFETDNKSLNLTWGHTESYDFNDIATDMQKQELLNAYKAFSYEGFSFDSIQTYDITIEIPAEPEKPAPDLKKITCMADYKGMTINEATEMWGNDYSLMEGLYLGGWKGVYYKNGDCPFVFYYSVIEYSGEFTGEELISGIEYIKGRAECTVTKDISPDMCASEVLEISGGELYENMVDGGYSLLYDADSQTNIKFDWYTSTEVPADVIVASFNYN